MDAGLDWNADMKLNLPELEASVVTDTEGREVELGRLWRGHPGPTVLVWLRHYG